MEEHYPKELPESEVWSISNTINNTHGDPNLNSTRTQIRKMGSQLGHGSCPEMFILYTSCENDDMCRPESNKISLCQ